MARATLTWTLPTTRIDGATLNPEDIKHTEISMSADGGENFSPPVEVPSDGVQTFSVDGLVGGSYLFKAVVVDMQLRRSADADTAGAIELTAPSAISDLSVVIE